MLNEMLKSVLETDEAPVVICDTDSRIVYMNPAAIARYHGDLTGKSIFDCHPASANGKILRVLAWFRESPQNNRIFTAHSERENKDIYMIALRDRNGELLGYYEKHEYRTPESRTPYAF